jgi:hypothetical protein
MPLPTKTRELHSHHFDSTIWNDFRFLEMLVLGQRRFALETEIHSVDRRRGLAEHANHPNDLATMQRGMFEYVSQNLPACQTRLNFSWKLNDDFHIKARLGRVFQPKTVALREFGPVPAESVK